MAAIGDLERPNGALWVGFDWGLGHGPFNTQGHAIYRFVLGPMPMPSGMRMGFEA